MNIPYPGNSPEIIEDKIIKPFEKELNTIKGVEKIKQNALENKANIQAMDVICSARKEGMTFQQIADKLNQLQYTTRRGKQFNPIQVQRLFKRCPESEKIND